MSMKHFVNRLVNGVMLKPLGLKLGYRVGSDPVEDMVALMHGRRVDIIVDGGAYKGTFSAAMAAAFPQASIHAFEPTPASHELLAETARGFCQIERHRLALGAHGGTAVFYSNASPLTNSLQRSSEHGHRHFHDLVAGEEELQVSVVALADFARERGISAFDIVKLDLQGNELDALRGVGDLIDKVQVALVEVHFVPLYESAPVFSEIEVFFRMKGLVLYQLYDLVRSPDNGRLLYGDALFVKPEILGEDQMGLVE